MTLAGARQKLKDNKETTIRQEEIVNRLKQIKEELLAMKDAFDAFAPESVIILLIKPEQNRTFVPN